MTVEELKKMMCASEARIASQIEAELRMLEQNTGLTMDSVNINVLRNHNIGERSAIRGVSAYIQFTL
jgi:hypothetical protein